MEANVVESYHKSFVILHFMIEKGQDEEKKIPFYQHLSQKINQQTDTDGLSISYLTMNTYRKKMRERNTATHHPSEINKQPKKYYLATYIETSLYIILRGQTLTPHTEIHIYCCTFCGNILLLSLNLTSPLTRIR